MSAAALVAANFNGQSSLYKDEHNQRYLLVLTQGDCSREDFDRVSNILSEYGSLQRGTTFSRTFLEEHCEALIAEDALKHLSVR